LIKTIRAFLLLYILLSNHLDTPEKVVSACKQMESSQHIAILSRYLNMARRIESWMSSTGWEDSHPLKFKCTFCNLYFRTEEEKERHIEEKHSDY
jgi:hypothetical protein